MAETLTSVLETAVEEFNKAMDEKWITVAQYRDELNEVIADSNAWQQDIASEIQTFMDDKSEKWLDSERGQEYEQWRQEFKDEISTLDLDQPDEISLDLEDYSELLGERREAIDLDA